MDNMDNNMDNQFCSDQSQWCMQIIIFASGIKAAGIIW